MTLLDIKTEIVPTASDARKGQQYSRRVFDEVRGIETKLLDAIETQQNSVLVQEGTMMTLNMLNPYIGVSVVQDNLGLPTGYFQTATHVVNEGDPLEFNTTGTLPGGLNQGTFFATNVINNKFQVAISPIMSKTKQPVLLIGVGYGNHTCRMLTLAQQTYRVWRSIYEDVLLFQQQKIIMDYFEDRGYSIRRLKNPITNDTLSWQLTW